jgi:hypothetical protein
VQDALTGWLLNESGLPIRDERGNATRGYCCLGVGCETAIREGVITEYNYQGTTLPADVAEWLTGDYGCMYGSNPVIASFEIEDIDYQTITAIMANDELKMTFDQIADCIEYFIVNPAKRALQESE